MLKIPLDAFKTTSKRVIQKLAEATGDLIGNKTANAVAKSEDGNTPSQPSKFRTKKRVEVNGDSHGTYSTNNQIKFKTSMLRSRLCDYSDTYIL